MSEPVAVLISDIHFSINTLELAINSLTAALKHAEKLRVPLIVAGDTNDTKAIIRGEVANAIIKILSKAKVSSRFLVGNHDLLNEKGEEHGLTYLSAYTTVIDKPSYDWSTKTLLIPYFSDSEKLKQFLKGVTPGSTVIMHQGFMGAAMGDYVVDKTSIDPELVKDFTVFSGHYHRHQQICPDKAKEAQKYIWGKGTITYIGNPYTLSFGEANDGPKGYLVLNSDGSFTQEMLTLRQHVVREIEVEKLEDHLRIWGSLMCDKDDLFWLKVKGPQSELQKINKSSISSFLPVGNNFKLDLIPTDQLTNSEIKTLDMSNRQVLESVIESYKETENRKQYLKELCNALIEG